MYNLSVLFWDCIWCSALNNSSYTYPLTLLFEMVIFVLSEIKCYTYGSTIYNCRLSRSCVFWLFHFIRSHFLITLQVLLPILTLKSNWFGSTYLSFWWLCKSWVFISMLCLTYLLSSCASIHVHTWNKMKSLIRWDGVGSNMFWE